MQVTIEIPVRGPAPTISIPYRRVTEFKCDIQRGPNDSPDAVTFVVEGYSPLFGSARIIGATTLLQSGSIKLLGETQTEPGSSAGLSVRAMINGAYVGNGSQPFSVCAHPAAVTNGPECVPHYSDEGSNRVGMYISIGVVSDSGKTSDLDRVLDQERVSVGRDQSESLQKYSADPDIGKFESAATARFDRHRHDVSHLRELNDTILRGQPGEWSNYQLDVFRCERCGMEHFVSIPNSGYRITRRITSAPPNRLRFSVTKTACDSSVDDWKSDSGPSDPQRVTIDVEMTPVKADITEFPEELSLDEFGMDESLPQSPNCTESAGEST